MHERDEDGSNAANTIGRTDGLNGRLATDNPYEQDSKHSNRWLDGWWDAQAELKRTKRPDATPPTAAAAEVEPAPSRSGRQHEPFTIDDLARALRGIPRNAPIFVKKEDGSMRPVVMIEGTRVPDDVEQPWKGRPGVVLVVGD